jgi:hypothetical protein
MDWRHSATIANEDAHITTPQGQQTTKPDEARDPDMIYQYGHPVGKVVAPEGAFGGRVLDFQPHNGGRHFQWFTRLRVPRSATKNSVRRVGGEDWKYGANPAAELCKCKSDYIGSTLAPGRALQRRPHSGVCGRAYGTAAGSAAPLLAGHAGVGLSHDCPQHEREAEDGDQRTKAQNTIQRSNSLASDLKRLS